RSLVRAAGEEIEQGTLLVSMTGLQPRELGPGELCKIVPGLLLDLGGHPLRRFRKTLRSLVRVHNDARADIEIGRNAAEAEGH
ncbi:hypothetical protein SB658_26190, partial [Bacillus sp. SIMBA_008]|uniref:hypothetical protein n=1 Tax=Bacillus sp. SIMBA_008 TaxID=3085757 RepID=UPI00397DCA1E